MSDLNSVKYAALVTLTGLTEGPINTLEWFWLHNLTGLSTNVEGMWHEQLDDFGIPPGPLPQRQVDYWLDLGALSSIWNEAAIWFWENGGDISNVVTVMGIPVTVGGVVVTSS